MKILSLGFLLVRKVNILLVVMRFGIVLMCFDVGGGVVIVF